MFGVEPIVVRTHNPCDAPVANTVAPPCRRHATGAENVELLIVGLNAVGEVAQLAPVPFSRMTVFVVVVEKLTTS